MPHDLCPLMPWHPFSGARNVPGAAPKGCRQGVMPSGGGGHDESMPCAPWRCEPLMSPLNQAGLLRQTSLDCSRKKCWRPRPLPGVQHLPLQPLVVGASSAVPMRGWPSQQNSQCSSRPTDTDTDTSTGHRRTCKHTYTRVYTQPQTQTQTDTKKDTHTQSMTELDSHRPSWPLI